MKILQWLAVLALTFPSLGRAQEDAALAGARASYAYRRVSLDELPEGWTLFDPAAVTNGRRVYGTKYACDELSCSATVAVFERGAFRELSEDAITYDANDFDVVAGSVLRDPINFVEQAALFVRGRVELIPMLDGEAYSRATKITESGIALVASYNELGQVAFSLWRAGRRTALELGPSVGAVGFLNVNELGIVSGTSGASGAGARAFRFNPYTKHLTLLEPLPTEPESQGQAISELGSVLGYSYVPGGLERVGVWRPNGVFQTWFVQGTPEFPTVSNQLLWNRAGLIVITDSRRDLESYLVPAPNQRLKVRDLVRDSTLPTWVQILDVNDRGDLLGYGGPEYLYGETFFLLERVGR